MLRRVAVIIVTLALNPALLYAQDTVLTVTVRSADVHSGPSTVTPVIGHVSSGAVLDVTRNLGSWAKVAWPDAPNGVGYVHVTMGRLGPPKANAPAASVSPTAPSARTSPTASSSPTAERAPAPVPLTTTLPNRQVTNERVAVSNPQGGPPISHILGVGGLVGSMGSFGATARGWHSDRLGIQVAFTRDSVTSDVSPDHVTSMRVEPGVVFKLLDRVSPYVWFRPYVGSGVAFCHETLKVSSPEPVVPSSSNGVGFRVFGGTELTFSGAMRFALSAEVGYRQFPTPFPGFEPDRVGLSIIGHWYVK